MNQSAQIAKLEPPQYFPPPPKLTDTFDDGSAAVVSAAAQCYTTTSSPTSLQTHVTDKEANLAYLLRYFRTLDLDEHDLRAVYPRSNTQKHSTVASLKNVLNRFRTKINNSFLSTSGTASSQRWFARVVSGFVLLHEFESHMFNLQHDILLANIALINETEAAQKLRLEHLEALKESFAQHKDAMIDKINRVEAYAPRHLEEKDSDEKYGDLEDPWYLETLNRIRAEYQSMQLWDPVDDVLDILPLKLTYIEKYGTGLRRSHDFWGPVWANPGYAESFFSDFKDVIFPPLLTTIRTRNVRNTCK